MNKRYASGLAVALCTVLPFSQHAQTIFHENFGDNAIERSTTSFNPYQNKIGNFFYADTSVDLSGVNPVFNKPSHTKQIEINTYAVVSPNYIWATGFKYMSGYKWFFWTEPTTEDWTTAVAGEKPDNFPDSYIGPPTNDNGRNPNGGVMVVNGGSTLAPFYVRTVALQAGSTYKLSIARFVQNTSAQYAIDFMEGLQIANGPTVYGTTWTPESEVGYLGTTFLSNDIASSSDPLFRTWETEDYYFTVGNGDVDCLMGEPEQTYITIYIRNATNLDAGNDFYIDDIVLTEVDLSTVGIDDNYAAICNNVDYGSLNKIEGKLYFNETTNTTTTVTEGDPTEISHITNGATYASVLIYKNTTDTEPFMVLNTVPLVYDAVAGTVSYSFDNLPVGKYDVVIHNNPEGAQVSQLTGGFVNTGNSANGTNDGTADGISTITITGTDVLDADFTIFSETPLSATSVKLQANNNGNLTTLIWETIAEDVNQFNIEKSTDAKAFAVIAKTDANTAAMVDNKFTTTAYYRIGAILKNGKTVYSNVVKLDAATLTQVVAAPNPIYEGQALSLSFNSQEATEANLLIIDINGKVMKSQSVSVIKGINKVNMELRNMPVGTYFLKAINTNGSMFQTIPVVISK